MFTVELYAGIRRAVMVDGLSRREAAKRFGVHRNTISKMLQFSVPPGYRRRERPAAKKLGPLHGLDRHASRTTVTSSARLSLVTHPNGVISGAAPIISELTSLRHSSPQSTPASARWGRFSKMLR